jgi:hypothetical protein
MVFIGDFTAAERFTNPEPFASEQFRVDHELQHESTEAARNPAALCAVALVNVSSRSTETT